MSLTMQQFLLLREEQNQRLQVTMRLEREQEQKRIKQHQLWQEVYHYVLAEAARTQERENATYGTSNGIRYRCKWGTSCFLSHCTWVHPSQTDYYHARWYQSMIPCRIQSDTGICPLQFPTDTGRYCPFSHVKP